MKKIAKLYIQITSKSILFSKKTDQMENGLKK